MKISLYTSPAGLPIAILGWLELLTGSPWSPIAYFGVHGAPHSTPGTPFLMSQRLGRVTFEGDGGQKNYVPAQPTGVLSAALQYDRLKKAVFTII